MPLVEVNMKRILLVIAFLLVGGVLAGCIPTVTVTNNTGFDVRVMVFWSGGREVLSPSPGESSYAEVTEGTYTVAAVPASDWIDYAKAKRQYLNDQLANMDNLSGAQLAEVVRQLKDIAARMKQYETAAGKGASCSGSITQEANGIVTVSAAADGTLAVTCGSTGSGQ
jgi:hypothetical protein